MPLQPRYHARNPIHQDTMADNPYEAPSANLSGNETFAAQTGGVTQGVVEQLRRTKGWTRFISVLSFIFGALLLLGAIFSGSMLSSMNRSLRGLSGLLGLIMFVYGIIGVLMIISGAKLGGFSSSVQRLMYSAQERDMEDALDRQRSFWIFAGVIMLIGLIVGIISMISTYSAFR